MLKAFNQFYTFNEYMKSNNLSPNEEDYIEMIYRLYIEREDVKISELSKALNIKPSSVSNMVKKLQEKDIINHEKYGAIILSKTGKELGEQLLYRHNLVEEFLNLIGIKEHIHEETEKIEHTISIETLVRISNLISFFKENNEVMDKFSEYQW